MNAARRTHFHLTGPSIDIDPRTNAVRGDLADIALAGRLFAPHYAEPKPYRCAVLHVAVTEKPGGEQVSELLSGETFCVLDFSGGFAWGYCAHDHYVGYVKADALEALFADAQADEPRAISGEDFLGMPYVWGGRGGEGVDCSGLVQRSLVSQGIAAPRDSDLQLAELGSDVPEGVPLQKGDLIFFLGHVGMMHDASMLLHATRHHGKVVIEPLSEVEERFKARNDGLGIIARRRIA